jgi:hypothetical protein
MNRYGYKKIKGWENVILSILTIISSLLIFASLGVTTYYSARYGVDGRGTLYLMFDIILLGAIMVLLCRVECECTIQHIVPINICMFIRSIPAFMYVVIGPALHEFIYSSRDIMDFLVIVIFCLNLVSSAIILLPKKYEKYKVGEDPTSNILCMGSRFCYSSEEEKESVNVMV